VVIEEDGKTEEEFVSSLHELNDELARLSCEAADLGAIVAANLQALLEGS